jgi:hypothetical protein
MLVADRGRVGVVVQATNSGPQNSTIWAWAGSRRLIAALRCGRHEEIGPKLVLDQSNARTSAPISPPPKGNSPSRLWREMPGPTGSIVTQKVGSQQSCQLETLFSRGECRVWVMITRPAARLRTVALPPFAAGPQAGGDEQTGPGPDITKVIRSPRRR